MQFFSKLFLLCWVSTVAASYTDQSGKQCLNLKGQYETCETLEFCSQSSLEKGCRSCREVATRWCPLGAKKIKEFQERFPPCAVSCELLKCERTTEELQATGKVLSQAKNEMTALVKALDEAQRNLSSMEQELKSSQLKCLRLDQERETLTKEKEKSKEGNDLLWIFLYTSSGVIVILIVLAIILVVYILHLRAVQLGRSTAFTATVEKKTLWSQVLSFLPFCKKQEHHAVPTTDVKDAEYNSLNPTTPATPTAPCLSESGFASNNTLASAYVGTISNVKGK